MTKKEIERKKNRNDELVKSMLKYFELASEREEFEKKQRELEMQRLEEEQKEEEKRTKDIEKMWKKFHKLEDKKVIDDILGIMKKYYDEFDQRLQFDLGDYFVYCPQIEKYFLESDIDIKLIFGKEFGERNYFDEYGLKERIRWEKITTKIAKGFDGYLEELKRREFEENLQTFVDKAIEEKSAREKEEGHTRQLFIKHF